MAALGLDSSVGIEHGAGLAHRNVRGARQPQTRATADFLAHTGEFVDPSTAVQHGSTNSHAAYDNARFHGRTRGCAHVGGNGLVYLDGPNAAEEQARQREAERVRVRKGQLEQERGGRGQYRAPVAETTSDFFKGSYAVDSRKEKRGEVRPLADRFADPQDYAQARQHREHEHAQVRRQQISQIEAKAAARAAQRRFSHEDGRAQKHFLLDRLAGPKSQEEVERAQRIHERFQGKKASDVESDPYRSNEGKRERRSVVLVDNVVGGASGYDYDTWSRGKDRRESAVSSQEVRSRGVASRSRFENPLDGAADSSQSIVDTQMRRHSRSHSGRSRHVSRGSHNFDRAVSDEEWIHKNVGKDRPQPRRLQDFETREQRYNDSLPKEAHENPTREAEQQRVADPRGLGRGFSSRDPEFRHVVGRPTQRW
eukprot:m.46831 g.46831  ORF g.46831 m.46831 type:complete len:425 (+) comp8802_c0_seq2:212-1486(+)